MHHEVNELIRANVQLVKAQLLARSPCLGEIGKRAGGQVVNDVDFVLFGKETIDECRTNESGATCDERSHWSKSHTGSRALSSAAPSSTIEFAPMTLIERN
jgi:hypothetical protein